MTTVQTITDITQQEDIPDVYSVRLTPRTERDEEEMPIPAEVLPEYVLDQDSISNRVYLALYGVEHDITVERGETYITEGRPVYRYGNQGYTYNEYLNLREFDHTFQGSG